MSNWDLVPGQVIWTTSGRAKVLGMHRASDRNWKYKYPDGRIEHNPRRSIITLPPREGARAGAGPDFYNKEIVYWYGRTWTIHGSVYVEAHPKAYTLRDSLTGEDIGMWAHYLTRTPMRVLDFLWGLGL